MAGSSSTRAMRRRIRILYLSCNPLYPIANLPHWGRTHCHNSPQLIIALPASTCSPASLRRCNDLAPPGYGGNQEIKMEMQKQVTGTTTMGIASEMLTIALHGLVAGVAAAILAGSLVVALTVIAG